MVHSGSHVGNPYTYPRLPTDLDGFIVEPHTVAYCPKDGTQVLSIRVATQHLKTVSKASRKEFPVTVNYMDQNGVGQHREYQLVFSMTPDLRLDVRPNARIPFELRASNDE
jgi:hypothetical protein